MKNLFIPPAYFNKKTFVLVISLLISLFSLSIYAESFADKPLPYAIVNNKKIFLEIADSEFKRTSGLMYRDEIGSNNGMLFIFDSVKPVSFWMKNVLIPLDMIFISQGKIVNIYSDVPVCYLDPCPVYPSLFPVDSVIEVNAGFCKKNNIKIGQNLILSRDIPVKTLK